MGVSIAINGRVATAADRRNVLAWASSQALELDWAAVAVVHNFPKARLVERGGKKAAAAPLKAAGIALLPHFACEPLPLVFCDGSGRMVDEVVQQDPNGVTAVLPGVIVKTQFAGPECHREICEFLDRLAALPGVTLEVDDETGFFETRDEAALAAAFVAGWEAIRASVRADPDSGGRFQVGAFVFAPLPGSGDAGDAGPAALTREQQDLLAQLEQGFVEAHGGVGFTFDRAVESITDLELAASDYDDPVYREPFSDDDIELVAHGAGAVFGQTLAKQLGGTWAFTDDDGLTLTNVGGCGLLLNPFQIAAARFRAGPAFGFTLHFAVFETLANVFRLAP